MKAITVRNIDEGLAAQLKKESRRRGRSINSLILDSIRASFSPQLPAGAPITFHDLDELAGTWTKTDEREFARATAAFEDIDPELWR